MYLLLIYINYKMMLTKIKDVKIKMELLIFLFKSGLKFNEIVATSEKRADQYRKVKGLLQKYYVQDESTGQVGGVFVFDSKENREAFKNSDCHFMSLLLKLKNANFKWYHEDCCSYSNKE